MCFAPQRHALFRHLNFQKLSKHGVFSTFWFPNVFRATMAYNFSSRRLRTNRFSERTFRSSLPFRAPAFFFLICFFCFFVVSLLWSFQESREPMTNSEQKWKPEKNGENHEKVDETHEEIDGNHRQTDEIHGKIDAKHDKIDEQCWNMKSMGNRCTTSKIDENRWQIDKNHRENDAHLGKTMEIIEKSKAKTKTKGQKTQIKTKKHSI